MAGQGSAVGRPKRLSSHSTSCTESGAAPAAPPAAAAAVGSAPGPGTPAAGKPGPAAAAAAAAASAVPVAAADSCRVRRSVARGPPWQATSRGCQGLSVTLTAQGAPAAGRMSTACGRTPPATRRTPSTLQGAGGERSTASTLFSAGPVSVHNGCACSASCLPACSMYNRAHLRHGMPAASSATCPPPAGCMPCVPKAQCKPAMLPALAVLPKGRLTCTAAPGAAPPLHRCWCCRVEASPSGTC